MPAFKFKVDYEYSREVRRYDYQYEVENGFHKMTQLNGAIVEANYVGGKQQGQCIIKYTDGSIDKG